MTEVHRQLQILRDRDPVDAAIAALMCLTEDDQSQAIQRINDIYAKMNKTQRIVVPE